MRNKKNQFLKYKMSYQETTKPAVSSNSYSSSSVQDMVQVNTTTSHLINKLNTFTTPYLKSNHQPGEEDYKELENDIKTLDEQVSQNTNDIELLDQKIDNLKGDLTADKYEWYAIDVSSEYDKTYNMKRAFNKYGDSFLIRSRATYTSGEYTIHECEVNTMYGPNIQYNFISDYVYIPSWIKDKDDDKIIYHIIECDFIMKNDKKNTELAGLYLAFSGKIYASAHYNSFEFAPADYRHVMEYAINNMSNKDKLTRLKTDNDFLVTDLHQNIDKSKKEV